MKDEISARQTSRILDARRRHAFPKSSLTRSFPLSLRHTNFLLSKHFQPSSSPPLPPPRTASPSPTFSPDFADLRPASPVLLTPFSSNGNRQESHQSKERVLSPPPPSPKSTFSNPCLASPRPHPLTSPSSATSPKQAKKVKGPKESVLSPLSSSKLTFVYHRVSLREE